MYFQEQPKLIFFKLFPAIKCPVYFFAGAKDYNTNSSITAEYYSKVSAPKKDLFLFNDAGHELLVTHSDGFQDMIIKKILPQTSR
jgi:alpha-beta hydrolase superfamily lysophospholipase